MLDMPEAWPKPVHPGTIKMNHEKNNFVEKNMQHPVNWR